MAAELSAEEFELMFVRCVEKTVEMAQEEVGEPLPAAFCFELAIRDCAGRELSSEEVLSVLYQSGEFPRLVDVAVRGVTEDSTIIWIRPSAHPLAKTIVETWNDPPGSGPFKPIGLMMPTHFWDRPRPFRISDLKDAAPDLTTSRVK